MTHIRTKEGDQKAQSQVKDESSADVRQTEERRRQWKWTFKSPQRAKITFLPPFLSFFKTFLLLHFLKNTFFSTINMCTKMPDYAFVMKFTLLLC